MSNKVNDNLHELIKYMSKSEKRYFKVLSSRHTLGEENNYILLFDFIESMEVYDEVKLMEHFKGEAFLNKISISKKRLYDQIINALDSYHSTNLVESQIYKLINSAQILKQKSLYHQAVRQLRSAEKLAQKNNKFNLLIEINFHYKQIHESHTFLNKSEIKEMLENDVIYFRKSDTYNQLWSLKTKLFDLLSSKGVSRSENELLDFKAIIDELLVSSKKEHLYFETEYLINHIYSAYHFATTNLLESYNYLSLNIKLLESSESSKESHISNYLSVISNAAYIAHKLGKNKELNLLREKLKTLFANEVYLKNEELQLKLFSIYYSLELTILTLEGQNEEALKLIPIIENGIMLYNDKLSENRKSFFLFKIACIYFVQEEFHLALKWINKILNNSEIEKQEDIISFAHLLSLLIHLEMKNNEFIPYILRACSRYLKTKNRLYNFEQLFLKFITKISKVKNEIEREEIASDFYDTISKFDDSDMNRVSFDYFDFISWAKAKSSRVSFKEVISKKLSA